MIVIVPKNVFEAIHGYHGYGKGKGKASHPLKEVERKLSAQATLQPGRGYRLLYHLYEAAKAHEVAEVIEAAIGRPIPLERV